MERAQDVSTRKHRIAALPRIDDSPIPTRTSSPFSIRRKASCSCGGGCPTCQAHSGGVKVSQPGDSAEIEADRIADQVMRMPAGAPVSINHRHAVDPGRPDAKCNECGDEEPELERKEAHSIAADSPKNGTASLVEHVVGAGGSPLDRETRGFFEPRLGYDLGSVRIHTDSTAAESARALDAKAYTVGTNIVFGSGEYRPDRESGKHLLAHELAHVAQQSGGMSRHGAHDAHGPGANPIHRRANGGSGGEALQVKAMSRKDAVELLGGDLQKGFDETAAILNIISATLDAPATMENARARVQRLTAAFSLLEPADAALVLKVLTSPSSKEQRHVKERFGRLDHHFREPLLGILKDASGALAKRASEPDQTADQTQPRYQEGKATWVELQPGVFAYVPDPGKTLKDVAAYVSRNPDLLAGLVKLNSMPSDKPFTPGQTVIVPVELIDRDQAIGEMSKATRAQIGAALQGKVQASQAERLMRVQPGPRGPGMYGLFPVSTLALTPVAAGIMGIVDALLAILKRAAYGISMAAGIVHGILASLWDTVSGIAKMIYDVIKSIVTLELISDIEKLIEGIKATTTEKLKEMLGEWAAEWDAKLNSSSPFIAGHAHGYLTGYVMAEVAMLLISGGATAELKAAFWATRIGKIIKASEAFATAAKAMEKAAEVGGKVSEVVDKVRQSRIGTVVKAADVVVTIAGWTLEKVGKVLSLPGDIAVYIVEKAFKSAEMLGPFFERIGKLAQRAKRWLFGCFSPCEWEADVAKKVLKQLTDDQIKIASEAANAAELKTVLGKPAKVGGDLPDGYHWREGDIALNPYRKADKFAPLEVDKKTGNLTIGRPAERISNPATMNRNYKAALKEELREANKGLSEAKLDAKVEKDAGENAVHHLIPDNIVQDHPLGVAARKAGYDLDRGSNLKGLKKTEGLTDVDAGDVGHWSSHPKYDKLVEDELSKVQKALEAEFGSLDNMLKNDKLKKRLLDEVKKVEDKFRKLLEDGKVPIDPDTGRLTDLEPANTEESYG
jgi:Domain of unknown function (DUF4157)/A nuclease family of the HNH/ENDO VII superfamily with conserved AHH